MGNVKTKENIGYLKKKFLRFILGVLFSIVIDLRGGAGCLWLVLLYADLVTTELLWGGQGDEQRIILDYFIYVSTMQ